MGTTPREKGVGERESPPTKGKGKAVRGMDPWGSGGRSMTPVRSEPVPHGTHWMRPTVLRTHEGPNTMYPQHLATQSTIPLTTGSKGKGAKGKGERVEGKGKQGKGTKGQAGKGKDGRGEAKSTGVRVSNNWESLRQHASKYGNHTKGEKGGRESPHQRTERARR